MRTFPVYGRIQIQSQSFIAENRIACHRRMANLAHLRKETQDVVTLRVGIGQQVEEDCGVSDDLFKEASLRGSAPTVIRIEKECLDVNEKLSKQRKVLAIQLDTLQPRRSTSE